MPSLPQLIRRPAYYARPLAGATDHVGTVVYVLFREAPVPSPDLIAGIAAFPVGYRPSEEPGQILVDPSSVIQFWTCDVRRDQLTGPMRIPEAAALTLYPPLAEFVALTRRALETTGELPAAS